MYRLLWPTTPSLQTLLFFFLLEEGYYPPCDRFFFGSTVSVPARPKSGGYNLSRVQKNWGGRGRERDMQRMDDASGDASSGFNQRRILPNSRWRPFVRSLHGFQVSDWWVAPFPLWPMVLYGCVPRPLYSAVGSVHPHVGLSVLRTREFRLLSLLCCSAAQHSIAQHGISARHLHTYLLWYAHARIRLYKSSAGFAVNRSF